MKLDHIGPLLLAVLTTVLLSGCGGRAQSAGASVLTLGSTSMEPVMGALAEQFSAGHPGVTVSVEGGGSGAGAEAAANGTAHIGLSSRPLKESEKALGLAETTLAIDGIAVIVHESNPVSGLTLAEIAALYTGETADWALVGGEAGPVAPIGREAGSGTRDGFESAAGVEDRCALAQELTSSGAVIGAVRSNRQAIGYASLAAVEGQEGIKIVPVDGVACTEATVLDGSYPIQRPFLLITRAEQPLTGQAKEFFDWATSADAAEIVRRAGAVPVSVRTN